MADIYSDLWYRIAPPTINNREGYVPEFTPAEAYQLQAQGYANQWDTAMAQAYGDIANSLWWYSKFANQSVNAADALINYIRENETGLQSAAGNLYGQLANDINTQRDYIWNMFWPEGQLTNEVNSYYNDLWNYLATDAGRQAAKIAAQWIHSWASLWAIRAQQNEAYNESFGRYIKAKEQQINAKQQIASNLINYMSTLRQEYWDTTNKYVIELYKRANDLYNNVAASVANDLRDYNKLRIQWSSSSSSSSSTTTTDELSSLVALKSQLAAQWIQSQDLDNRIVELQKQSNNAEPAKDNVIVTEYDNPDEKVWMTSSEKKTEDNINSIYNSAFYWWAGLF